MPDTPPEDRAPSGQRERYPGYDVMAKQGTPSWNPATRAAVQERLEIGLAPRFLDPGAFAALQALCDRILPQPASRPPIPLAAYVDDKLRRDRRDGYRNAKMPPQRDAWTRGLAALDAEAEAVCGVVFARANPVVQDDLIGAMAAGRLHHSAWSGMPPELFFSDRVMADIPRAYYAHPLAWNEIGFGGPASPRGYVRMDFDKRDPWEAVEASPRRESQTQRANRRVGR